MLCAAVRISHNLQLEGWLRDLQRLLIRQVLTAGRGVNKVEE